MSLPACMVNPLPDDSYDDSYINFLIFCFMRWVGEVSEQTTTKSFRDYFEDDERKSLLEQQFEAAKLEVPLDIWFDPDQLKILH